METEIGKLRRKVREAKRRLLLARKIFKNDPTNPERIQAYKDFQELSAELYELEHGKLPDA